MTLQNPSWLHACCAAVSAFAGLSFPSWVIWAHPHDSTPGNPIGRAMVFSSLAKDPHPVGNFSC